METIKFNVIDCNQCILNKAIGTTKCPVCKKTKEEEASLCLNCWKGWQTAPNMNLKSYIEYYNIINSK